MTSIPAGTPAVSRPARRWAVVVSAAQGYLVLTYLLGGVLPYLWRGLAAPPIWAWYVFGWILGAPGFIAVDSGAYLTAPLALVGAAIWVTRHRRLSPRTGAWLAGTTVAGAAVAIFAFTPLARAMRAFILD